MATYHAHLAAQGQFLDVDALVAAVVAAGGQVASRGPSQWRVPPTAAMHAYMVDFLASGTATPLWRRGGGWDVAAWRTSVLERGAAVLVDNEDLLLRLPSAGAAAAACAASDGRSRSYDRLDFIAPRCVQVVAQPWPAGGVQPGCAALTTAASMISSGTELLIYRGLFDTTDEPLDATIKGLSDERLAYPMAYGYSLVGHVAAVGAGVPASLVGRLAFAFAPHAAGAHVNTGGMQLVPRGIGPEDATFLPAVETAISIVHDAHPRASEVVHVHGAGVIGLLVVATLRAMGVTIVAIDPDAPRRALAVEMGAAAAYHPRDTPGRSADVSIECSGSPQALQGAIDGTMDAGRVVLASWYGRKPVELSLGTRFHRSHIELVATQVPRAAPPARLAARTRAPLVDAVLGAAGFRHHGSARHPLEQGTALWRRVGSHPALAADILTARAHAAVAPRVGSVRDARPRRGDGGALRLWGPSGMMTLGKRVRVFGDSNHRTKHDTIMCGDVCAWRTRVFSSLRFSWGLGGRGEHTNMCGAIMLRFCMHLIDESRAQTLPPLPRRQRSDSELCACSRIKPYPLSYKTVSERIT